MKYFQSSFLILLISFFIVGCSSTNKSSISVSDYSKDILGSWERIATFEGTAGSGTTTIIYDFKEKNKYSCSITMVSEFDPGEDLNFSIEGSYEIHDTDIALSATKYNDLKINDIGGTLKYLNNYYDLPLTSDDSKELTFTISLYGESMLIKSNDQDYEYTRIGK